MEQSEEEELSSNTEVESIQHDVDIKGSNSFLMLVSSLLVMYFFFVKLSLDLCTEMKHHDYPSSSPQANSDTGDNRPSLELQGMVCNHLILLFLQLKGKFTLPVFGMFLVCHGWS